MISFYDWSPVQVELDGGSSSSNCRGAVARSGAAGTQTSTEADRAAKNDPEVQAQICQKIQDAVDISDVFNKVAVYSVRASPKTLAFAVHRIARYCRLRRQDTSRTRQAVRWSNLLKEVQSVLQELDPQGLTDIVWSLAVLNHREPRLLAGICHQAFNRVDEYAPANLAITAWSLATLGYRDDLTMKRINRQALGRLPDFEAQSLANMAWALATMRFKDDVLMHHIAGEALHKMHRFSAQHVANTSWAYATLGRRASVLFDVLEDRAVELLRDPEVDFCPLDLALSAWSFAWLEHAGPDSKLLRAIVPVAIRRLSEFSSQQLANMLWGFDHANFRDGEFYSTVGRWCCARPGSFWQRAAGEELVSILTALQPFAIGWPGWHELETTFRDSTLRPLASFLATANTDEGYTQGLRKLRTYHAGALYTGWLLEQLKIEYLGDADAIRTQRKVEDLVAFYLQPPVPRWLPDGYEDDDVQACRAEIPGLLELLDVKRRVQPSSHFIALHLSAELTLDAPPDGYGRCGTTGSFAAGDSQGADNGREDGVNDDAGADLGHDDPAHFQQCTRSIWRSVPTRPPRRSGLSFVRGEKFEEQELSGDETGTLRTSTLRDYQRKHHAEVTALTQIADLVAQMDEELASRGRRPRHVGSASEFSPVDASAPTSPTAPSIPVAERVSGYVELFVPHYPCSSCTGALAQFCVKFPRISVRVGHDDWRHWLRRLDERWDPGDKRHHNLSINARQLRDLDLDLVKVPEAYRNALRGTLGEAGVVRVATERDPPTSVAAAAGTDGYTNATQRAGLAGNSSAAKAHSIESTVAHSVPAAAPKRQSFY